MNKDKDFNQQLKEAIETHSDRELVEMVCEELCPEALQLAYQFFQKEPWKAIIWMRTENPLFGNMMPIIMIARGRGEKVLKTMRALKEENGW